LVVEGQDRHQRVEIVGHARALMHRLDLAVRQLLAQRRVHVEEDMVVHAVEMAFELQIALAPGDGARDPQRRGGGFRAAATEANLFSRGHHFADETGDFGVGFGFVVAVEALVEGPLNRGLDGGVVVPQEGGARGAVEIDITVAVEVEKIGTVGAGEIERPADQRIDTRRGPRALQQIIVGEPEMLVATIEPQGIGAQWLLPAVAGIAAAKSDARTLRR
jgi:hypothetical protein